MARITLRQLLDHAAEHSYGVPAFNINNMEQGLAIMEAASAVDAPVIIQASRGARAYDYDVRVTKTVVDMAHWVGASVEGELGVLGSLETGMGEKEDGHGFEGKLGH